MRIVFAAALLFSFFTAVLGLCPTDQYASGAKLVRLPRPSISFEW